jgi:hypothetical protein
MTSEQKKAIDACKDQACLELPGNNKNWESTWINTKMNVIDRAMQLYGEQCREEGYADGYRKGVENGSMN